MDLNAVAAYARRGREQVDGWLARVDAEIFRSVLEAQASRGLSGGMAEIGVHHGKSFLLMALGLSEREKALAVDLFSLQEQNLDGSGKGDLEQFQRNMQRIGVDRDRVRILEQSSLDLTPQQVLDAVGPVRFFSVDGGHWLEAARNDLSIAEQTLAPYGVIALDDFHRPEWPEVSAGFFAWFAQKKRPIVPFLIGYNKLYLCDEQWAGYYREKALANDFLHPFVVKTSHFMGQDVPVLSAFALPEFGWVKRIMFVLRSFSPDLFRSVRRLGQRMAN
jgi:SAM-dependent methyltransferase